MKIQAYPNDDYDLRIQAPRNVKKWMDTMTEIFVLAQKGHDFKDAFEHITSGWDVMEKMDFKKWMDFYQENAHVKYKTAFRAPSLIDNGHGSFVPNIDNLRAGLPFKQPDMTPYTPVVAPSEMDETARQEMVKKKIQALISRLSAAEKIATNPEVQVALKKCIDMPLGEWLSMLQQLKREIQLAPMRSTSLRLMDDIVIKNANRAINSGKHSAGILLLKVAQGIPGLGEIAPMNPAVAPMGGQPQMPAEAPPNGSDAIQEFLKNMNGDISSADDSEEDEDEEKDDLALITVTAQMVPEEPVAPEAPPPAPAEELAVSEDELVPAVEESNDNSMDAIDLALENVKISDIVARLEAIASLFKNRQIARQLSVVDLMMDKLGIAPFFPTLAEAMRSALESNQYCQSRIEEILAKLRGTMETPMSQDLEMHQQLDVGALNPLQQRLQQDEDSEKARRERRKQLQQQEENAAIEGEKAPPPEMVDAPAEIAGPAEIQTQPNAVRPVG